MCLPFLCASDPVHNMDVAVTSCHNKLAAGASNFSHGEEATNGEKLSFLNA